MPMINVASMHQTLGNKVPVAIWGCIKRKSHWLGTHGSTQIQVTGKLLKFMVLNRLKEYGLFFVWTKMVLFINLRAQPSPATQQEHPLRERQWENTHITQSRAESFQTALISHRMLSMGKCVCICTSVCVFRLSIGNILPLPLDALRRLWLHKK